MSACTFFGHRDCPSSIKSKLRKVLIDLIESHAVDLYNLSATIYSIHVDKNINTSKRRTLVVLLRILNWSNSTPLNRAHKKSRPRRVCCVAVMIT